MFLKGQVLYFSPFFFKNGNTPKNKYFIVLKNIDGQIIVASLPTSSNHAPSLINLAHGCINHDDRCFNCYAFEANRVVATNGFSFPLATYVYGNEVETYELSVLQNDYQIENIDYEILGLLTDEEFNALYNCLKNSTSVKRGIKKLL